jgi:hypothetical protein
MAEAPDREDLLPGTASPLEVVFVKASRRFTAIPTPINTVKTPTLAPAAFLPFIAGEVTTDLWHTDWADAKKRSVIAGTLPLKMKLGTLGAIRDYIAIEGGLLIDAAQPPQIPFAGAVLGPADYTAWLGRLPQLRIYFGNEKGQRQRQDFAGRCFAGHALARFDKGRALRGRHAFYYDPTSDTQTALTTADIETVVTSKSQVISETASVQGKAGKQDAFTGGFAGQFLTGQKNPPSIVSWTITTNYTTTQAVQSQNLTLGPSVAPISTRTERVSVMAPRANRAFAGRDYSTACFARANEAEIAFYDRLYLADPSVPAPVTRGTSFCDHARLGIKPYTAELLVEATGKITKFQAVVGGYAGRQFATAQESTKRDRIVDAIRLAQAGRDRVYVDFERTRPLLFGDGATLDGSHTFSDRLQRTRL